MSRLARLTRCLALLLGLAACTPVLLPAGPAMQAPGIAPDAFVMADGARLPYRAWLPEASPRAVILGLHGFGDYSFNAFDIPAPLLTAQGIALYAYDQRGFGAAPHAGLWAGGETLAADAVAVARLVRARHPGVPLYLLGESMGAAVVLVAAAATPPVDGYLLLAPGVRGRATMSGFARRTLEFAAGAIPAVGFSGSAPGFSPTDNPEAMRRWSADPLTAKIFRVDFVYGLVNLMDQALAAAAQFQGNSLILYGGHDVIVPGSSIRGLLRRLPPDPGRHFAFYPEGHHLLLRDEARAVVARDIAAWVLAPGTPPGTLLGTPLPSGAEAAARAWLEGPALRQAAAP